MVEPGVPGQVPKEKGVPKDRGVPRDQGVPRPHGVPKAHGVPREAAILPGTPGRKRPGEPGQLAPGTEGQLDKTAANPWAPTPDTVLTEDDAILPPSSPDRGKPATDA